MASSIATLVVLTARLDVNDIAHAVRTWIKQSEQLEDQFVEDLVLLPRVDYVAGKWFGGVQEAQLAWRKPELGRSYDFLESVDDDATRRLPVQFAGRLVTAVSQAGAIALANNDTVIQSSCFELASVFGMRVADAGSMDTLKVGVDELQAAASVLRWVVERVTVHGWDYARPERSGPFTDAFLVDADRISEFLEA